MRQPIQKQRPALRYSEVLRRTLSDLGDQLDIPVSPETLDEFSVIAATHKPFSDSVTALAELRSMGLKLAALSNIDDDCFAKATSSANISFDVVVTAQRVGAYKPDQAHFWAALSDIDTKCAPSRLRPLGHLILPHLR